MNSYLLVIESLRGNVQLFEKFEGNVDLYEVVMSYYKKDKDYDELLGWDSLYLTLNQKLVLYFLSGYVVSNEDLYYIVNELENINSELNKEFYKYTENLIKELTEIYNDYSISLEKDFVSYLGYNFNREFKDIMLCGNNIMDEDFKEIPSLIVLSEDNKIKDLYETKLLELY